MPKTFALVVALKKAGVIDWMRVNIQQWASSPSPPSHLCWQALLVTFFSMERWLFIKTANLVRVLPVLQLHLSVHHVWSQEQGWDHP